MNEINNSDLIDTVESLEKSKNNVGNVKNNSNLGSESHKALVHEGEKLKCNICEATFTQQSILNFYIKLVHE